MLNNIKKILYQYNILKPKTTIDKIDYLKLHNISLYDSEYRSKIVSFVTKDIVEYNKELVDIIEFDLYGKYITVKKITPNIVRSMTFDKWCSEEGRLLSNEIEILNAWLTTSKQFLELYETASRSVSLNILYSNSMKIRPYASNVEDIVDELYTVFKNK